MTSLPPPSAPPAAPPAPPAPKKKKRWLGQGVPPPPHLSQGAVIYDGQGNVIIREGSELVGQRYAATHVPKRRSGRAAVVDIPYIVERYISLVGKVVQDMDERAHKAPLSAKEVNSVAAIGRAVAMLQVAESASLTRVGGKPVKEHTSDQLRALLARSEGAESADDTGLETIQFTKEEA